MNENIQSIENQAEKIPNEREVLNVFEDVILRVSLILSAYWRTKKVSTC